MRTTNFKNFALILAVVKSWNRLDASPSLTYIKVKLVSRSVKNLLKENRVKNLHLNDLLMPCYSTLLYYQPNSDRVEGASALEWEDSDFITGMEIYSCLLDGMHWKECSAMPSVCLIR